MARWVTEWGSWCDESRPSSPCVALPWESLVVLLRSVRLLPDNWSRLSELL